MYCEYIAGVRRSELFEERSDDTLKRLVDVIKAALIAIISKAVTVNVITVVINVKAAPDKRQNQ